MCLGLQSRVRRWLVARVTPPPPAPPPAHALACLLLTSRSLSLSPSLFGQSLLLATTTPFPPCPYPLTRGPDGGYWSESGEQIAWKNLLRGYLPTYQPTYLPTYLPRSLSTCTYPTYHHPLTYTEPATFRPIHSVQVNAFPLDEQRIETHVWVPLENAHALSTSRRLIV